MKLKIKRCRVCLEELPAHEFRLRRGWRRERADTCEKCELEARLISVENRRRTYRAVVRTHEEAALASRRTVDPTDD